MFFFLFFFSLLADVNICSFSTFSGQLASLLFKINIIIDRFDFMLWSRGSALMLNMILIKYLFIVRFLFFFFKNLRRSGELRVLISPLITKDMSCSQMLHIIYPHSNAGISLESSFVPPVHTVPHTVRIESLWELHYWNRG